HRDYRGNAACAYAHHTAGGGAGVADAVGIEDGPVTGGVAVAVRVGIRKDGYRLTTLHQVIAGPLPSVHHVVEEAVPDGGPGQVPNPGEGELVADVEGGVSAVEREITPIQGTARVHAAAEQLVGRVVNIVRVSVVAAEEEAFGEPVLHVNRPGVVNAVAQSGKRGGRAVEFRELGGGEGFEIRQPRAAGDDGRHLRCREERRQGGNAGIECGKSVESGLDGQFEAAGSEIAEFQQGVFHEFTLQAQGPGCHLGLHSIEDEALRGESCVCGGRRRDVHL